MSVLEEPFEDEQISTAFDVNWARSVLAEAVRRMAAECEDSGRADIWGLFELRLRKPILEGTEPIPYEELVARYGLSSPAQAQNLLTTAKRMFGRCLKSVVAEYARDETALEIELQELRLILQDGREG